MTHQTLRLDARRERDILRAAAILRRGGLVAFPTETVYGLGANALDSAAVGAIFAAKGRPSWDPLIVHIASAEGIGDVAEINATLAGRFSRLSETFWPGPLTMLLPRAPVIPDAVTAGRDRVGVRVPAHPVAQAVLRHAGVPLAAPSANRFGYTSPTTAGHVLHDLDGRVDAVLDGGATPIGVESTVLDVAEQPMRIYRPGAVSLASIEAVAGRVVLMESFKSQSESASSVHREGLPSPGVGLRHYAPRAPVVLVHSREELLERTASGRDDRVGVMLPEGWQAGAAQVFDWGPWDRPEVLAQRLFAGLRALDEAGVDRILCPLPRRGEGIAAALRDRLLKAALQGDS